MLPFKNKATLSCLFQIYHAYFNTVIPHRKPCSVISALRETKTDRQTDRQTDRRAHTTHTSLDVLQRIYKDAYTLL